MVDDAERYEMYEPLRTSGPNRVDFFGNAPGIVLERGTSIFFRSSSFAVKTDVPITVIPLGRIAS